MAARLLKLGYIPGGIRALIDLGQGRAFSTGPFRAFEYDWSGIVLLRRGEPHPAALTDDGLPLPKR